MEFLTKLQEKVASSLGVAKAMLTPNASKVDVLKVLRDFEEKHNVKVLYCTKSGSRLYGTENKNSDTDYKFLFAPAKEDVLLKRDVDFLKHGADTKVKNGADDVDFDGSSVYKFMKELQKSETGAVDVLFSMFQPKTVVFEDPEFTKVMKENYTKVMNRNMKSFIGYALGQTQKFGVKGARYDELTNFVEFLETLDVARDNDKLETLFDETKLFLTQTELKYVKFQMAPGPRGNGGYEDVEYMTVLGKMFEGNVTVGYMKERVLKMFKQFGNRTKTVAATETKTDFKALSHALRVAMEVEELLLTGFVKFPLQKAERLKEVKEGRADVEEALDEVRDTLGRVDVLLESTDLPEQSDKAFMDSVLLSSLH